MENEEISYVPMVNYPTHCQFTRYDIKSWKHLQLAHNFIVAHIDLFLHNFNNKYIFFNIFKLILDKKFLFNSHIKFFNVQLIYINQILAANNEENVA